MSWNTKIWYVGIGAAVGGLAAGATVGSVAAGVAGAVIGAGIVRLCQLGFRGDTDNDG